MTDQENTLGVQEERYPALDLQSTTIAKPGRGSAKQTLIDFSLRAGSIFTLVLIWWILSLFFPPTLVPKPPETFAEVATIISTGNFLSEMGSTLRRVLVGFGLAMIVSIPLGILMGTLRSLESFFEPPVILGLTMPGLIWAVLMIMFFGLNETSAYAPAWQRTKIFLLPADFKWPDAATLNAEKSWLQQGVELGMFSKESVGFIDVMFTP